jgi:hypothetical protein
MRPIYRAEITEKSTTDWLSCSFCLVRHESVHGRLVAWGGGGGYIPGIRFSHGVPYTPLLQQQQNTCTAASR